MDSGTECDWNKWRCFDNGHGDYDFYHDISIMEMKLYYTEQLSTQNGQCVRLLPLGSVTIITMGTSRPLFLSQNGDTFFTHSASSNGFCS